MIRALVLSVESDPEPFVAALRAAGIPLHSYEERGQIVLAVRDESTAGLIRQLHAAWQRGDRGWSRTVPSARPGMDWYGPIRGIRQYPGLAFLLVASFAAFPWVVSLVNAEVNAFSSLLLIVDVDGGTDVNLARLAQDLEPWRWLTPIFIHFSFMHIAFNAAVVFEFGRRIEMAQGTLNFLLLVVITGILSNLVQVQTGSSPLFGGLSGVGYGLLGYILVRQKLDPQNPAWSMHPAVPVSMLIFLVLFSAGITEPFGMHIANGAHWGGLVSGALLSLLAGRRRNTPPDSSSSVFKGLP